MKLKKYVKLWFQWEYLYIKKLWLNRAKIYIIVLICKKINLYSSNSITQFEDYYEEEKSFFDKELRHVKVEIDSLNCTSKTIFENNCFTFSFPNDEEAVVKDLLIWTENVKIVNEENGLNFFNIIYHNTFCYNLYKLQNLSELV